MAILRHLVGIGWIWMGMNGGMDGMGCRLLLSGEVLNLVGFMISYLVVRVLLYSE